MAIWVLDYKSSSGVYPEYLIQVSVYLHTHNLAKTDIADHCGILRLDKETGLPEFVDATEGMEERWKAFLALREYYRYMLEPTAKQDRWYTGPNGKKYPTVTTILGLLDKPALPQWSANLTVEYIRENLAELVKADSIQLEYILKKAKTAFRAMSKKAMDTGSIVHDAVEAFLAGSPPEPILEGNDKATNAFLAFLEWKDKVKLQPISLERKLIHPEYEFGGTCDLITHLQL